MRNILKSIILSVILVCSCASQIQAQDRDVIRQKVELRISTGECEKARENYKIFKELYGSDSELERKLANCGQSTTTNSNTPRKSYEPEMVFVQGGTFTMGCTSEQGGDCEDDEKPTHQVTLNSYYIGKYEVTQKQWQEVMGTNPSYFKGDNLPVENVSWNDVQEFIRKLNAQTGKNYRLPTEAEWEFACRGGARSAHYKYAGSNNIDDVVWYKDNSNSKTHAVGTKQANELGIYDMSGNVREWCSDWYGAYSSSPQTNPKGVASGSYRVRRGGNWYDNAQDVRVTYRTCTTPDSRSLICGFRLALNIERKLQPSDGVYGSSTITNTTTTRRRAYSSGTVEQQ
jgi:formylglycine-generating enzyme required for sulfatase activity